MKSTFRIRIFCRLIVLILIISASLMAQTTCSEGITNQNAFDKSFDRTNVNHASFSCDLHISATTARAVLESLRNGILYQDTAALNKAFRYPVVVVLPAIPGKDTQPKQVEVHNAQEWYALQKSTLNQEQLQTVASSWLGTVTIVGTSGFNPGFIIDNGLIFFKYIGLNRIGVTHINLGA